MCQRVNLGGTISPQVPGAFWLGPEVAVITPAARRCPALPLLAPLTEGRQECE